MSTFQVHATPDPPPRIMPPAPDNPFPGGSSSLPRPLTALVAREADTETVASLLRDPDVRLLTLTGPGGVGKTRLAIAAARAAADAFPGGLAFVDLSPVTDHHLVLGTIANGLRLRDTDGSSLLERLVTAIADRKMLLLVDNFEQVINAAGPVRSLLDTCSGLNLLITSRTRLRVSGEREFPVAPLSLGDSASVPDAGTSGAIRLFFERARAVRPDFEPGHDTSPAVAEIVRRVDGLPLAIELAAARIKVLPPVTLLQRLEQRLPLLSGGARDLPLRQQTMRDTIGWSYDLLDDAEKTLFRRLGVFVGGFTLEAAEAIAASSQDQPLDAIEGISALIDHSLLRQGTETDGEPRYLLLETVREYALVRLTNANERDAVQRQHAIFYLELAGSSDAERTGASQATWLARLDREQDNLRAALNWSLDHGEGEMATRLGALLWPFWELRGRLGEGRALLARILALPPDPAYMAARCEVLTGAGVLAALQGDYLPSIECGEQALAGWRDLDDQRGMARALLCLATVARFRDDYAGAASMGQESLTAAQAIDDRWGIGHALSHLGMVAWVQGDHTTGITHYEEALMHLREAGDDAGIFEVMLELGKGASDAGDVQRATAQFQECLAICTRTGDQGRRGETLNELGVVARLQGDHPRAMTLLQEAATLAQINGDRRQMAYIAAHLGDVGFDTSDITSAATHYAESLRLFREMGNRAGIARGLSAVAHCAHLRGQFVPAVRLLGSCALLYATIGATPAPDRDPHTEAALIKPRLSRTDFDEAWEAGQALDLADAVTEAQAIATSLILDPSPGAPAEPAISSPPPPEPESTLSNLGLTPREIEVLRLLAEGMSDRDIAETLSISERTAGNHVQHSMQKIGVESRTAAAVFAVRHGIA